MLGAESEHYHVFKISWSVCTKPHSLSIEPSSLQHWNPEAQFLWDVDQWDAGATLSFLWAQDPKNNQIERWQNVVPQDGIADLSFQLSDEPLLGTYVINVTSARAYGSFSVKEHGMSTWGFVWAAERALHSWPRKQGGHSLIAILGANGKSSSICHRKEPELRVCRGDHFGTLAQCVGGVLCLVPGLRHSWFLWISESDKTRQFRMDFSREYEVQCPLTSILLPNQLCWEASLLKIAVRSAGTRACSVLVWEGANHPGPTHKSVGDTWRIFPFPFSPPSFSISCALFHHSLPSC